MSTHCYAGLELTPRAMVQATRASASNGASLLRGEPSKPISRCVGRSKSVNSTGVRTEMGDHLRRTLPNSST